MITAAPRARPGRWRRRAFALLTVLLVLLLLAVGLEVGFRCCWTPPMPEFQQAGLYVQEPDGGFGLLPGYRGTLQVRADLPPTEVAINALGLRGPEIGPRVPGERRVLCVGDSMVFGYGVDAAAAFPAQLQQQLSRQLAAVVTVGNAGVPSYGTVEAARQLRRMLGRFHADAAVFCIYLGNDAIDDQQPDRLVEAGHVFQGPLAQLMRSSWRARLAVRSRFLLWLETWLWTNRPQWSPLSTMSQSPAEAALLAGFPGSPPAWQRTHAGLFLDVIDERTTWQAGTEPVLPRVLARMRSSLLDAKVASGERPLIVLILTSFWHVDQQAYDRELANLQFAAAEFRRGLMQQRLLALAAELGLAAADAATWFEPQPDHAALFLVETTGNQPPFPGHFSPIGHALIAERLAELLAPRLK